MSTQRKHGSTDWAAYVADIQWPSPEEDAAITAAALADPDCPPMTDEQLAKLRPTAEVDPEFFAAMMAPRRQRDAAE